MTWNIEGVKANIHALCDILLDKLPDFCFISEPQLFQADLQQQMIYVQHEYCCSLNSEDDFNQDLSFRKSRTFGGTLGLWRRSLDPYVTVHPTETCSFLPIILKYPGCKTSIHFAIYLPTHGKDAEYVADMASLINCIEELSSTYNDPVFFIRGDGNTNPKNTNRLNILNHFISHFSLKQVNILHPTYHHFTGNGRFDSKIDIILHSLFQSVTEVVTGIHCKNENPEISSHHDVIFSSFTLPLVEPAPESTDLISAPRTTQERRKIVWSPEGILSYQNIVSSQLKSLRQTWLNPSSMACTSVLLQSTNKILNIAAQHSNKYFSSENRNGAKQRKTPKKICNAKRILLKTSRRTHHSQTPDNIAKLKSVKRSYRQTVRSVRLAQAVKRDQKLDTILLSKPSNIYSYLRSIKTSKPSKIEKLTVANKVYVGSSVADGFYDSMTSLKTCNLDSLKSDNNLSQKFTNYDHILKICKDNHNIPPVSETIAGSLLKRMKSHVMDFYGVTALHYTNAGKEGLLHFTFLLNSIILEVNNATLEELNRAYGLILYKGHRKEKTSDRSYRTISSCPFLAKALDLYLRDLYQELWNQCTATTQYQANGSSHELASLLITEIVQFSLNVANNPVYFLVLDAESAFDRCLKQILCCELYRTGVTGDALLLINNRLSNRSTVYHWDGELLGPAADDTGFEQGGINSGDYYKLYNNEQLKAAQSSLLGVNIGSSVVSSVGCADDVILASNDIYSLCLLATLTENYCKQFRVKLVPSKTKLLPVHAHRHRLQVYYAKVSNQVTIAGAPVKFVDEAEHVGVLRSTTGNMLNIVKRITAHKAALSAVAPAGLSRNHRENPAASLRIHQLYATPVLFSGLASLALSNPEVKIIDAHYRSTIQNLQRLHQNTPRGVIYFLAGSLPGEAILHKKQLSLFSMICHLPSDPLAKHAAFTLSELSPSCKSWFFQIRDICMQYGLPSPLQLLQNPVPKERFKNMVKLKFQNYWHSLLTLDN